MMKQGVIPGLIGGFLTLCSVLLCGKYFGLAAAPIVGLLAGRVVVELAGNHPHDFLRSRFEGAYLGTAAGVVFLSGQFAYAILEITAGRSGPDDLTLALPLGCADVMLASVAAFWTSRDFTQGRLTTSAKNPEANLPEDSGNHFPAWRRRHAPVHHRWFSKGSIQPFEWYFEGESTVRVRNVREICDWLRRCEYALDHELFFVEDHWQHPVTFEQMRKGDCEDHALWAWRKLVELGYHAELVVGMYREYHAWVVFEKDGRRFLLESTHKSKKMLFALEEVHEDYAPEFSVDGLLKTYEFGTAPRGNSTGATKFTALAVGPQKSRRVSTG